MIFDVPEDNFLADIEQINELMETLDVQITVRNKQKRSGVSIAIKGIERNASKFLNGFSWYNLTLCSINV